MPSTRRTWAPHGHTPVIRHRCKWKRASMAAALCYGSRGGGASLAFHHQVDADHTDSLIGALGELRRFLGGQKATLLSDELPAHRSKAIGAWLSRQRSWLVVEPLPAYAPEVNPAEPLWSSLKGMELANLAGDPSGGHRRGRAWRQADPPHSLVCPSRSCATVAGRCGEDEQVTEWANAGNWLHRYVVLVPYAYSSYSKEHHVPNEPIAVA